MEKGNQPLRKAAKVQNHARACYQSLERNNIGAEGAKQNWRCNFFIIPVYCIYIYKQTGVSVAKRPILNLGFEPRFFIMNEKR
mmetsp:Transcript_4478/g.5650  ORF Transcript_4478/g.5650 Transcript_4478/m.5650 type:complete len:83 (+) Transcript_4478:606-854(+)